jgi:hypothetical protein
LIPVVDVAAARVLLALSTDGVVLGVSLVFFVGPYEVIMSLSLVVELGRRRPKSSKVRRW